MLYKYKSTTVFKFTTQTSGILLSFEKDEYIQVTGSFVSCLPLLENSVSIQDLAKKVAGSNAVTDSLIKEVQSLIDFIADMGFLAVDKEDAKGSAKAKGTLENGVGKLEVILFEDLKFDVYAIESWEPMPGFFSSC